MNKSINKNAPRLSTLLTLLFILAVNSSYASVLKSKQPTNQKQLDQYITELFYDYCKITDSTRFASEIIINDCYPSSDYIEVSQNGKLGLANRQGDIIIPINYDKIHQFNKDGLTKVELDNKAGFVNNQGKLVIPLSYQAYDVREFSNGLAAVVHNDKVGYINQHNEIVIPFMYDELRNGIDDSANNFKKNITEVKINDKHGVINSKNELIIPIEYDDLFLMTDELTNNIIIRAKKDGKYGLFDQQGNILLPLTYAYIGYEYEGLINVQNDEGKRGFVTVKGKLITPVIYDSAHRFSEGLAVVELSGKYGYINKQGKVSIPLIYDSADSFEQGLAAVEHEEDGLSGLIDATGQTVIPFIPSEILSKDLFIVQNTDYQYVLVDAKGEQISQQYDKLYIGNGKLIPGVNEPDYDAVTGGKTELLSVLLNSDGEEVRRFTNHWLLPIKRGVMQGHFIKINQANDDVAELIDEDGHDTGIFFEFWLP